MSYKSMKETDLAYLAGFIDGEGCFFIGLFKTISSATGKPGENYHTILKISNTCERTMRHLQVKFGGLLRGVNHATRKSGIIRPVFDLVWSGDDLTDLTKAILPYLVLKEPQAKVMLKMRSTFFRGRSRGQTPLSEETKEERLSYFREIRKLNSRFASHPLKLNPCPLSP